MASNKTYWKNIDQLDPENVAVKKLEQNEFVSKLPEDFLSDEKTLEESSTSRRDFLKYVGFSTAAATLAACEGPVIKSVPYVVQPEQIRPGIANYYATTIADGFDFGSILIKTREGRPIKVESNSEAPTLGIANARIHASVLSLYDTMRLQGPEANGDEVSWDNFYLQTGAMLKALAATNKEVVLITPTLASPTSHKIIGDFVTAFPNVKHVIYDAISSDDALNAYEKHYGIRGLADYDFSKAKTLIAIDADFLGDWQGGGYAKGYAASKVPHKHHGKAEMLWHAQFESNMSLSGANADHRVPCSPGEQKNILAYIYDSLIGSSSSGTLSATLKEAADKAVSELKAAGPDGVIITGIEDETAQSIVLAINTLLKSNAFQPESPKLIRQGNTVAAHKAFADIQSGAVKGLITIGVNPIFTTANGEALAEGIKKLEFSLAFASKKDETAAASQFVAATPHYLESWGDYEMKAGHFALAQPTIRPLFDTQQFQDVLLKLSGQNTKYYDVIKAHWNESILGSSSWSKALHDGYFSTDSSIENITADFSGLNTASLRSATSPEMSLVLYTKTGMGDGQQANNPWLQEFPDPITRVSWDNYLTISMADANRLGLVNTNTANGALNGSYANVTVGSKTIKVPVIVQPGQAKGTVGLSFGYGERMGLKPEMQTGVNAFGLYEGSQKTQAVQIQVASGEHEFACVQLHNTLMGRGDIVKETTLEVFNTKDKKYWNATPQVSKNHIEFDVTSPEVDMWQEFDRSIGHHFNLSIDLNSCTGCGACVVACHAENNVPVVGKAEVRKSRDMHWLRIDRYYSSATSFEGDNQTKDAISGIGDSLSTFGEMEQASANPQIAFQPVMCQHCNHAPCETVCPVAASSHGRQGQNHMAYNRCVGTRYCANNCPYKVRRFNWFLYNKNDEFDYHMNNDLGRMVLNPDVVVRSRGVMEKCSMCIQMTQKTILDAKLKGEEIKDGTFQTACSNACTTGAMVFGDINDKESKVAALHEDDRMYHLLESVGTKPNVMYHVKVRNTDEV
ncbi:TAT-variant-translocated molybdopterin oxidoreductase [Flavobacteriaceae bacterium]|nr:TAT-variant-translocated molybdopterin oxidoreductase [Flavobacteriaceae bacterium]MBT5092179.1 TAT-variant-translocated molybdopterin oxidoreductase [Flavobacteriaceae bacterium]MBT5282935.1 TAT-variant-translocated molybdopterin oxidoreductase [Flavobacteriaceae bacterium]MBT5447176.1 TAT-variant-translocated molybdopterin oxidoreductase [Flavobacteriaceae bacterium]MBT5694818.1 TAT-variant-translocated molybdopterin oxidoreductase [Flavobacteriaceae bacterium]